MRLLVTGGAGFIGSALVRHLINGTNCDVLNLDKLTYAGNLSTIHSVKDSSRYRFSQTDICNKLALRGILSEFSPTVIMHLAAESHVDRSIADPTEFIETNVIGTYNLLESARNYYEALPVDMKDKFRFLHVSTDEVYGSAEDSCEKFSEVTPYAPSSPYSASKASSDHLVRAWGRTYNLPVLITNCSNNYGPYQFPEKLIPLMILNALEGKPLPVYGNGQQIRDWLYVEDHARALYKVATQGQVGETYNIGGHNEKTNIEVVHMICDLLDEYCPNHPNSLSSYKDLIRYVTDRPGHDQRYAIDASKIHKNLGWAPIETFESGLRKTVQWYLKNITWCQSVQESSSYRRQRLGT